MPIDLGTIVEKANDVQEILTGSVAQIQRLVACHDVVIGVWQDAREPGGVGTHLVKGQRALMDIATSSKSVSLSWTAIPCTCAKQAAMLQDRCGEAKLS